MNPFQGAPEVLAVTRDTAYLRSLRVSMPLTNLKRQGLVRDFFVTSPSLFDVPDDMNFDVVWLQRPTNRFLVEHLEKKIGGRYLVDLDDLLMGTPSYAEKRLFNGDVLVKAIHRCQVLTVTSMRLAGLIEKYAGTGIMDKTMLCPNGFEFSFGVREPSQPSGILLASSDSLAMTTSKASFCTALDKFSKRHSLPVYYFGDEDPTLRRQLSSIVFMGKLGFWHYHALLASLPPMIGLAPLETTADAATLDFINGKSDIKMVDFGGFGHPSVYSDAPPYTDTDLTAGVIVENSEKGWLDGLTAVFEEGWQRLDQDKHGIHRKRNMNKLAAECWHAALLKARLPEPLEGSYLKFSGGRSTKLMNQARHILFSQEHFTRRSMEQKSPSFLVGIARKFLGES